ncbi:hypothetical protein THIOM_000545 [Candidatus Thiomargarita nelsonii]|uniref:Uncharacterized protein n=1 Tax=Candidatus Thiomargarita nelsonii TaxID=1003181 RepID=A0A176S6R8_9GAMM|nr:hypothetical protein THIOM_000545 [Candidatus Thiomargarita nelsonii]
MLLIILAVIIIIRWGWRRLRRLGILGIRRSFGVCRLRLEILFSFGSGGGI